MAVRPVARGQAGVDDLSHLVPAAGTVIVVIDVSGAVPPAPPVVVVAVVVVDVAELPQGDQGQVRDAAGLLRRLEQHLRPRAVGALEPVRREPVPRVLVLQRHHALLRLVRFLARLPPGAEKLCDPGRDRIVGRCAEPLPAARPGERHVVDEARTIAAAQGPDLVGAVGVEGRPAQLEPGGRTGECDLVLPAFVPDHELSAFVRGRQGHDQRGHHRVQPLPVTVRQEEAPILVEQQLVQVGGELALLESQALPHLIEDRLDQPVPLRVGQLELRRVHLPHTAHVRVHERARTLAVGRLPASADQGAGLGFRQRQSHRPKAGDLRSRHRRRPIAGREYVARPVDSGKGLEQVFVHGSASNGADTASYRGISARAAGTPSSWSIGWTSSPTASTGAPRCATPTSSAADDLLIKVEEMREATGYRLPGKRQARGGPGERRCRDRSQGRLRLHRARRDAGLDRHGQRRGDRLRRGADASWYPTRRRSTRTTPATSTTSPRCAGSPVRSAPMRRPASPISGARTTRPPSRRSPPPIPSAPSAGG